MQFKRAKRIGRGMKAAKPKSTTTKGNHTMSLEQQLQDAKKSIEALTEAVSGLAKIIQTTTPSDVAAKTSPSEEGAKTSSSAKGQTVREAAKEKMKAEKAAAKEEKEENKSGTEYEAVRLKTVEAVKATSKQAVLGVLAEFGDNFTSAKDLSEDQYDDYIAKLETLMEEGGTDDLA